MDTHDTAANLAFRFGNQYRGRAAFTRALQFAAIMAGYTGRTAYLIRRTNTARPWILATDQPALAGTAPRLLRTVEPQEAGAILAKITNHNARDRKRGTVQAADEIENGEA